MGKEGNKKKRKPSKTELRIDRFPYEYVIDLNGQKAAERCGVAPRGARVWASRLLTKPNIQSKIKELLEERNKKAIKTAEDWDREIDMIAFFRGHRDLYDENGALKPIKDLTEEQLAVLHEVETTSIGGGQDKPLIRVTKLRLYDKLKALDLKGKRLAILSQKMVHEAGESFEDVLRKIRGLPPRKEGKE